MRRNEDEPTVLPINDAGEHDFTMVPKNIELMIEAQRSGCWESTYGTINWEKMEERGFITTTEARRRMPTKPRDTRISIWNPENDWRHPR